MITDIVRASYKKAGYDPRIEFLPWKRGKLWVLNGRYLATFPYVPTAERKKEFVFSDPVFESEERPVVLARNAGSIASYADMNGMRTCLPLGWSSNAEMFERMVDRTLIERATPQTLEKCFEWLENGRVDFIPLERTLAEVASRELLGSADAIHAEDLILGKFSLHLMFAKTNEATQEAVKTFNSALQSLRSSGKYDKIIAKHLK